MKIFHLGVVEAIIFLREQEHKKINYSSTYDLLEKLASDAQQAFTVQLYSRAWHMMRSNIQLVCKGYDSEWLFEGENDPVTSLRHLSFYEALFAGHPEIQPKEEKMSKTTLQTRILKAEETARYRAVARKLSEECARILESQLDIDASTELGQFLVKIVSGVGLHMAEGVVPPAFQRHADRLSDEFLAEAGVDVYAKAYDTIAKPLAARFVALAGELPAAEEGE